MLYRVFKWLFYLTVKGYFNSLHLKGLSNIPATGPVIFVANHNSAFMDPILLAVHIKRPIYFLARGESFTSKWVAVLFNWLHMIPIYKPDISPDEVHKNKAIFQKCYDHLRKGKTIMIFPEGVSETVRKLRPIKTGTARIALGAEQQNDFTLGVKIIPIGINYSNPHYFRSDVFVHFGSPISSEAYQMAYDRDPITAVQDLTAEIKARLEEMIVIVKDESLLELVADIERLYRNMLSEELTDEHRVSQDFYLSQEIVKAVQYNTKARPRTSFNFQQKIRQYFEALDELNIHDAQIKDPKRYSRSIWNITYFIFGFPVFLYGLMVNILPYKSVALLARKIIVRKDFIGSMKLAFGMFVFLLFYIVQILLFSAATNWIWGLVFALTLYPGGLFAINYINQWYRYQGHLTYLRLKRKKKSKMLRLRALREGLLVELDRGRQRYLEGKVH